MIAFIPNRSHLRLLLLNLVDATIITSVARVYLTSYRRTLVGHGLTVTKAGSRELRRGVLVFLLPTVPIWTTLIPSKIHLDITRETPKATRIKCLK